MTRPSAIVAGMGLIAILLLASKVDGEAAQVGDRITQERVREMQRSERLRMYSATLAGCARGESIALDDGETLISIACEPVYVRIAR